LVFLRYFNIKVSYDFIVHKILYENAPAFSDRLAISLIFLQLNGIGMIDLAVDYLQKYIQWQLLIQIKLYTLCIFSSYNKKKKQYKFIDILTGSLV